MLQYTGAGMAAIGSFSSLLFINFLVVIGRFALHYVDRYSPNDGLNRLVVFTFFDAGIALRMFPNNYNNGRKLKINLAKNGFKNTSYSVSKWSKHGHMSLVVAGHDPPVDITIFVDVSRNPGPVSSVLNLLLQDAASVSNLHVRSTITIYTRSELFNLRRVSDTSLSAPMLFELKNSGILRYRGCRAGRRKIPTIISSDDIHIASTSLASLHTGVVRSNYLISIPLRALPAFVYRCQLCNFALVNARFIRNKTLMLNDFIVEHDVDIFAITETWLYDSDFDDFFCSHIGPAVYNFFHNPRTTSHGGGVAVLTKKPFKVVIQQLANFKSFEAYEAVLKSSGNYNLRLVNVYRPPPSTANGLSVALFLKEFSTYLEHLNLAPGLLLMCGDFNFHVDRPNDSDSREFMTILDSFDLIQHIVGATHWDGHTLDLIITRVSDDGLVSNSRVGDCISDHFAVHCDLQFKKPLLERKEITCRKTCSIDFTDFRYNLSNSHLVLDPADDLEALVRQYNVTLKSMLDTHAPLKTRTVTVRPYSPWFTEEIAIDKRKRRALKRRWR